MSLMLMLIAAAVQVPSADSPPSRPSSSTGSANVPVAPIDVEGSASRATVRSNDDCQTKDAREVLVCAQRPQGYRLDPAVAEAARAAEAERESVAASKPAAQAACSHQPMGCPSGLGSLDLANVAVVAAKTVVTAAKGEDWTRIFRSNPDEYQLYLQAKRRQDAQRAQAAAIKARDAARAAK